MRISQTADRHTYLLILCIALSCVIHSILFYLQTQLPHTSTGVKFTHRAEQKSPMMLINNAQAPKQAAKRAAQALPRVIPPITPQQLPPVMAPPTPAAPTPAPQAGPKIIRAGSSMDAPDHGQRMRITPDLPFQNLAPHIALPHGQRPNGQPKIPAHAITTQAAPITTQAPPRPAVPITAPKHRAPEVHQQPTPGRIPLWLLADAQDEQPEESPTLPEQEDIQTDYQYQPRKQTPTSLDFLAPQPLEEQSKQRVFDSLQEDDAPAGSPNGSGTLKNYEQYGNPAALAYNTKIAQAFKQSFAAIMATISTSTKRKIGAELQRQPLATFSLDEHGGVINARIKQTSGSRDLDTLVIQALHESFFPPIPRAFGMRVTYNGIRFVDEQDLQCVGQYCNYDVPTAIIGE